MASRHIELYHGRQGSGDAQRGDGKTCAEWRQIEQYHLRQSSSERFVVGKTCLASRQIKRCHIIGYNLSRPAAPQRPPPSVT